jgi:aminomethyltransferase
MAMLAIQGPRCAELITSLTNDALPSEGRNNTAWCSFFGQRMLVTRTGYTGEPVGFELFLPREAAAGFWERLVDDGAGLGIIPVGLGARDTLRLEACLPLYGHEYTPHRPIMSVPSARFGVDLSPGRGEFIGRQALIDQRRTTLRKVMAVAATTAGMMREGSLVMRSGTKVGELTSGTAVPAWRFEKGEPGNESYVRPIGLALLDANIQSNQAVEILYGKRTLAGVVAAGLAKSSGNFFQPIPFRKSHQE